MKKFILVAMSLLITGSIFASEVESCSSVALGAVVRDGEKAESNSYSAEIIGELRKEMEIVYYFNLAKKEGERKRIAVVTTDADCRVISVNYSDAK